MQAQRGNWRNFASPQVVLKKKEPARLARLQDGKPCWETWQAVNVLEIEVITIGDNPDLPIRSKPSRHDPKRQPAHQTEYRYDGHEVPSTRHWATHHPLRKMTAPFGSECRSAYGQIEKQV